MLSPLGVGVALLAGLAVGGAALLVVPTLFDGDDEPDPGRGARQTAEDFWDATLAGRCREASERMWWPADLELKRDEYQETCRTSARSLRRVDVGEPGDPSGDPPFGASSSVFVPITVKARGVPVQETDVEVVQVEGTWFVTR